MHGLHRIQALAIDPGSREAVMNLANVLRNLGKREEAMALSWEHILRNGEVDSAQPRLASNVRK